MAGKEKLITGTLDALLRAGRWVDQETRGIRKRAVEAEDEGALADLTKEYKESFDPETYYHFSKNPDIRAFDPEALSKEGIYTDIELDAPEMRGATYFTADKKLLGEGKTFPYEFVYPVKIKNKDIFDYTDPKEIEKITKFIDNPKNEVVIDNPFLQKAESVSVNDIEFTESDLRKMEVGSWTSFEKEPVQAVLKAMGYRGFKTNEPQTVGLFFPHRGDVRSVYAKFDPVKAPHGDILASVPIAATVGAGALSQLADD